MLKYEVSDQRHDVTLLKDFFFRAQSSSQTYSQPTSKSASEELLGQLELFISFKKYRWCRAELLPSPSQRRTWHWSGGKVRQIPGQEQHPNHDVVHSAPWWWEVA